MINKVKKISSKVFATVLTFVASAQVASADWIDEILDQLDITRTDLTLPQLIVRVLNFLIGFAVLAAVATIVVSGIMYITAAGDENKIGKATKTLTFAIIGLVVCFIAAVLVNFVLKIIGVDL